MSAPRVEKAGCASHECPRCSSQNIWRNGQNSAGNQQYRCKTCGRVFVCDPHKPHDIKVLTDRMIKHGVPVPVISKVMSGYASRRWIYNRRQSLQARGELHV